MAPKSQLISFPTAVLCYNNWKEGITLKKISLCFFIFLGALATNCKPRNTYEAKLLSQSELPEGSINAISLVENAKAGMYASVDEFIGKLPAYFFRPTNFVLMQYSESECGDEVSPEYPRAILFDRKSRLIVSYTGIQSGSECSKSIRIFQGSKGVNDPRPWTALSLLFSDNNRVDIVDSEAGDCAGCHSEKMLPIWNADGLARLKGQEWPGAYGGNGGLLYQGLLDGFNRVDFDDASSFEKVKNKNGRYQRIPGNYDNLDDLENQPGIQVTNQRGLFGQKTVYKYKPVPNGRGLQQLDLLINPRQ